MWDLPLVCLLRVPLSTPKVSMHTHANVEMDLKCNLIIPIVPQLLWDLNTIKFQKHFSFFKIVPFHIVIALYSKHRPKLLPQNDDSVTSCKK